MPEPTATAVPTGERFVVLLDTMAAIADHALDVDCDYECTEWAVNRASEALNIFFGQDDWKHADLNKVRTALRQ